MEEVCEGKKFSLPSEDRKILAFWSDTKAFETQLERTRDLPEFVFYDGPPFATGLPHYGHVLAGTIKDIVTRYKSMTGYHVTRRFGWDCHGLPVEWEIDQKLEIKSRDDVLKLGIDKYNEECRSIVCKYVDEWEKTVVSMGRWIDFKGGYKTMDLNFMESVWWVFGQLYEKGLVYRGVKVVPYSTGFKTPLSQNDATSAYKDVSDPEIMVAFPLVDDEDGAALVAWTTTPLTLPSNLALCVNPNFMYLKVHNKISGKVYVVSESRLSELPVSQKDLDGYEVLDTFRGDCLVGKRYVPLFDYFKEFGDAAFRVISDDCVLDGVGTGVVHFAPAFGEDDYRVCVEHEIINRSENLVVAVDEDGCFTEKIIDFKGRYVKEADKAIIQVVKEKGRLVKSGCLTHSYPVCPRSKTPLINRAVPSWFIAVEKIKNQMLQSYKETYWVPDFVKEKRFRNWLENARDWAVSRTRFWGTPIPVWTSEDGEEIVVMDSIEKLEKLSGVKVTGLHRHEVDHITLPSARGSKFGVLRRVDDVLDCWFESGCMPYAYIHYPFENVELFENNFPGDFVAEGLDQTRGWFYSLMVLSTALFGKPAFKNLICNGLVLGEDGKKMSKREKNYPPPSEVINDYGADALRLYIINSPLVRAEPLPFKKEGVYGVVKDVFLPWYNAYRFLVQNVKRVEVERHVVFVPIDQRTLQNCSSNVLDQWINSATQSLVHFVRQEMDAYRLYTVVPYLLKFLDNLTNIYVRFNRKRLKGRTGEDDCRVALSTLYHVLLTSSKAMAPFTPFFTEVLYQNMRRVFDSSEESIHHCSFPVVEGKRGERIEESVGLMMRSIKLARDIRERHNQPVKVPLREMTIVHRDSEFLDDISEKLKDYILEELNVKSLTTCNDILRYASLRAEPNYSVLGKRLGKSMGAVAKAVKAMSTEEILAFQKDGQISFGSCTLKLSEIKLKSVAKRPDTMTKDMDVAGDDDLFVILDLHQDLLSFDARVAREIVNRIQKLRQKTGLQPMDRVEVFLQSLDEDKTVLEQVLVSQGSHIKEALGCPIFTSNCISRTAVVLGEEQFHGVSGLSFEIKLARPCVSRDTFVEKISESLEAVND